MTGLSTWRIPLTHKAKKLIAVLIIFKTLGLSLTEAAVPNIACEQITKSSLPSFTNFFRDPYRNQPVLQCGDTCTLEASHILYENYVSRLARQKTALSRVRTYLNELLSRLDNEDTIYDIFYGSGKLHAFHEPGTSGDTPLLFRILNGGFFGKSWGTKAYDQVQSDKQFSFPYSFKNNEFVEEENKVILGLGKKLEETVDRLAPTAKTISGLELKRFVHKELESVFLNHLAEMKSQFSISMIEISLPSRGHWIQEPNGSRHSSPSNFQWIEVSTSAIPQVADLIDNGFVIGLGYQVLKLDQYLKRNSLRRTPQWFAKIKILEWSLLDLFKIGGHALAIVDYERDAAGQITHWIGLNSWGKNFGDNGHFRIPVEELKYRNATFWVLDPNREFAPNYE